MINLNSVSKIKRELILQALHSWEENKKVKSDFKRSMKDLGWSSTGNQGGSFKECLSKKSIVVKYARSDNSESLSEVKREFEQYTSVPAEFVKYFPKIYAFNSGLLIQDKVLLRCNDAELPVSCNLSNVVDKFDHQLNDYHHNHGHSIVGTVKFFDWVYRRRGKWMGRLADPLYEE